MQVKKVVVVEWFYVLRSCSHKPAIWNRQVWWKQRQGIGRKWSAISTYFPQTEINQINPARLVANNQDYLFDVERDNEIHNETESKWNINVTTGRSELSQVNKAATERRNDVKNMLKNRKDKKVAVKVSSESQLLQVSRDDFDFKIKKLLEKTDKRTKNLELVSPNQIKPCLQ